jgi:hypothetical protein
MEDIQYLLSSENDPELRTFRALSRDHDCNAMRVVFFDAVRGARAGGFSCLFGLFDLLG